MLYNSRTIKLIIEYKFILYIYLIVHRMNKLHKFSEKSKTKTNDSSALQEQC